MPNLTNFSDDFIKSIVSSIHSAVTDDIIQDIRQADMERSGMNSYPSRIWDLINRNVRTAFTYNPDVVVEFTKRGPWNLIVIFDKTTGINDKVIGFLSFRPNYLMGFDSGSEDLAFPTPRAWEMVSNILNGISVRLMKTVKQQPQTGTGYSSDRNFWTISATRNLISL